MSRKGLCVVLTLALGLFGSLIAEVPHFISYQGRMVYESGEPMVGRQSLTFTLYPDSLDGDVLWTETHDVVIDSLGLYNVMLGTITTFPDSVDFSQPYWLGITLESGSELYPRYRLSASPYALNLASMGANDRQMLQWNALESKWQPIDISGIDGSGSNNFCHLSPRYKSWAHVFIKS